MYKIKEIDITKDLNKLLPEAKVRSHGGAVTLVSVSEIIPGIKFQVSVDTMNGNISFNMDKKINDNLPEENKITEEFLLGLHGISTDSFMRAPIGEYTIIFSYFNEAIIKADPELSSTTYPLEGLYVVDVVPAQTGIPMDFEGKRNFSESLGLHIAPVRFHGQLDEAFSRLNSMANTSVISEHGSGIGVRIAFEPRNNNEVYIINGTEEMKKEFMIDTPRTFVEEFVNFIVSPEEMINVHKLTKKNPITKPKIFVNAFVKYIENQMPDMIKDYYEKASALGTNYTYTQFLIEVKALMLEKVNEFAPQMDYFKVL